MQNAAEIAAKMGAGIYATPIALACMEFNVNNDTELAHFLAQTAVESAGFRRVVESLNYSVDGLLKTFSRRRISAEDCHRYGRLKGRKANQVMIGDRLYGGEWGLEHLGNRFKGDGFKFRGHGLMQLTGRDNIGKCSFALFGDQRLLDDPYYLTTPEGAARSACWYWKDRRCQIPAIRDDIIGVRRLINSGLLGLEHAEIELAKAKRLLGMP